MRTLTWALLLGLIACGGSQTATDPKAVAQRPRPAAGGALEPKSGSTVTGFVEVSAAPPGVHLEIRLTRATPGKHGVHLHETGDCSSPDAKSAGGHFNPDAVAHGGPAAPPHHAGDLGNMEVGADGNGHLAVDLPDVTLAAGPKSIVGRSVVVHAKEDDLTSQPAGNSGDRVACGVIVEAP